MRNLLRFTGHMISASVIAGLLSAILLGLIARVHWPAYPSSNQLHALTTVGQVVCLSGLVIAGYFWAHDHKVIAWLGAVSCVGLLPAITLGMPLGATRLYLFGISVDQQFRTEYLTRFADQAKLADMTYWGLPSFYPPGWFWLGGRLAAASGIPAWQMYKPWAIISLALAAAMTLVLWTWLVRFGDALVASGISTLVTVGLSSAEPYAALVTMLLAPVLILSWRTFTSHSLMHRWASVIALGIFLGVSANFYTLLTVYIGCVVVVLALCAVVVHHRNRCQIHIIISPLYRLIVIGIIGITLAAITWGPYLIAARHTVSTSTGSARHYLPADGAQLSFPMLQISFIGIICLVGTIWLIVHIKRSSIAFPLGMGVLGIYVWCVLSMLATIAHTTLLGFRLNPPLVTLFAIGGGFGFIWLIRTSKRYFVYGLPIGIILGLAASVEFAQQIPEMLRTDIAVAYSDTDGLGQRADRRPPGAEKYYPVIDEKITRMTGVPRDHTIVLTADYSFLSYYPYWGFQGLTSHYANPLAQFNARADAIESWKNLHDPGQFIQALDHLPWKSPRVFILRHGIHNNYSLRLAKDVYPNQPNVRRYTVELDAALFSQSEFDVSMIGPFVVAIRTDHPSVEGV